MNMAHSYLYSIWILFSFLLFFSASNSTRISLTGNDWTINNGQTLQATGTVPGTIHTILLAAKLIDEPYWSFNDVNMRYLVNQSWTFTKNFTLQSDFLSLSQFLVHFDQVDTVSNITLNDCYLGNTTSMFYAYTYNVSTSCLRNNNILRVDFMSPIVYALDQAIAYNKTVVPTCTDPTQHGECHVQFIRKEPCSFSWDWGPAFAPIGITGDVYLEGINNTIRPLQLDSVNVIRLLSTNETWQVDVQISGGSNTIVYQLNFQLLNTSWSFSTNVQFNENTTITLSIPNQQISLWWPNGHGNQPLYELVLLNNNQQIGSRSIGFRTIELVQENYTMGINGSSFYFRINSQAIYIKGSNWIPPDSFQERVSDQKLEILLQSAKLAGMNMLRVWGGGIYERDSFYHIADRLGIMLWHDFMFACSLYPVDQAFLSNVRTEVLYQVQRLQSHPSIVLWAGNNENEATIAYYTPSLPPEEREALKNDYRKLYIDTVMVAVMEIDPYGSRPFVPSSPSNGIESAKENYTAKNPQDPLYGDVHFYNYDMNTWNGDNYPITRFLSETGVESMPSLDTWLQTTNSTEDLNFTSTSVVHRQHHPNGQQQMINQIENNLPLPVTNDSLKNFTQLIYLTQINQAMTLKTISDHCRYYSPVEMINPNTSQGNTMGLMYWQINDIWQAPTWASIEYGLKWKMAHYYAKHMYSPIYVLMRLTPYLPSPTDLNAQMNIYLVSDINNTTMNQINCSVKSFDSFDSRLSVQYDINTNSSGVQLIDSWPYRLFMELTRCSNSSQCLMMCSLITNNHSSNELQTLLFSRPKDIQSLLNPNLQLISIEQKSFNEIDFTIKADNPAFFVWLNLRNDFSGYFSRNGFHMFDPQVTITYTSWTPLTDFHANNADLEITSLYDVTTP